MTDLSKIINPQAFIGVFEKIPDFKKSEILDIQLKRDGSKMIISLMTMEKVQNKPKKWGKWDVVYVDISFLGLKNLSINGFGTNNIIELFDVKANDNKVFLNIQCSNKMSIVCEFDWMRVNSITPGLLGNP